LSGELILDDPVQISRIDKKGMLSLCLRAHALFREALLLSREVKPPGEVKVSSKVAIKYGTPREVVIAGMGGSSIGGELLKDYLLDVASVPILIHNDYELPAYADEDTLVFVNSYSGETEETLSAFVEAVKRGCMIVAVTSGGHLKSLCNRLKLPCLTVPSGLPPRAALPYFFFPSLAFMEELGLASVKKEDLLETERVLEEISEENSPQVPLEKNLAKSLALNLHGTIPVIYGSGKLCAVAHRWKTQLNENSKVPCKYEVIPELNHNEVVGWEAPEKLTRQFSVVLLRDSDESPRLKLRIEATKKIALRRVSKVLEVQARGKSELAKMFSLVHLGDLVSVYLAILSRVDPWPVETISKIKSELGKKLRTVKKLEVEVESLLGD